MGLWNSDLFGDSLVACVPGAGVDPGLVAGDGVQEQAGHLPLPALPIGPRHQLAQTPGTMGPAQGGGRGA